MVIYPIDNTWSTIPETVLKEIQTNPGETVATIATNTKLTQEQVYWALSELDGQIVIVPDSDAEFITVHGNNGKHKGQ